MTRTAPVQSGSMVTLTAEKPVAGGRMLARHEGLVVLVEGTIPGEQVSARIDRVAKGLAHASTIAVLTPSQDRRAIAVDAACGGHVYAHIDYERQRRLKGEIIHDAFARIGRLDLPAPPDVVGSPEHGYRMRARLHARGARLGFFREGTHELCDAAATGQLLPSTNAWLGALGERLRDSRLEGLAGIEVAENVAGDVRVCHLELHPGVDPQPFEVLAPGLAGLSAASGGRAEAAVLAGSPVVSDRLQPAAGDASRGFELRRNVRAFFQGNRFLLQRLLQHVASRTEGRPVVDLYAGVGLFGLGAAAAGAPAVTVVEGDPAASASLADNAAPFGTRVRVSRTSVETFLAGSGRLGDHTVIADPPRTGLSREALAGILRVRPARLIYVSCDIATFARDARFLCESGYHLRELSGMDMYPGTAHVESVGTFDLAGSS